MKAQEKLDCQLSSWYDTFRRVTFKTEVIPLPEEFVQYLHEDGIVVADDGQESDVEDDDSDGWDTEVTEVQRFPELEQSIVEAISRLGGTVLPKLNWSAPRDATWLSSLECRKPSEIFMLLKASDFVAHDLSCPFEQCEDANMITRPDQYSLVLRRWHTLSDGMEFRCFVWDNQLIAISQRDYTAYFPFLAHLMFDIERSIHRFFVDSIQNRFTQPNFAFDVYIDRPPRLRVWLLDFNPWGACTDTLLFSWQDLELLSDQPKSTDASSELAGSDLEAGSRDRIREELISNKHELGFVTRILHSEESVRPSPLHMYRLPTDALDLSNSEAIQHFVDQVRNFPSQH